MFKQYSDTNSSLNQLMPGLRDPVWKERHAAFLHEVRPAIREKQFTLLVFLVSLSILLVLVWWIYLLDHPLRGSGWALSASILATIFTLGAYLGKRFKVSSVVYRHDFPDYEALLLKSREE